ncbi:uncharacterized protein LOC122033317 [Zingiber officinale]|uniref:uncharacterized protein LOC122033317 n=1 Tax=Zingiber officinale TaxID=94328 RepID=UPI001C4D24F9|nr:uncharacterized protein LOC122033317 [Zingiber officinale]
MSYNSNSLTVSFANQRPWRRGVRERQRSSSPERLSQWPGPMYRWPEDDANSSWRLFEERVRTGPFGLSRFPSQPHSPVRILVLDDDGHGAVNPRLTQFIRNSPPRIRGEWNLVPAGSEAEPAEDPGLSEEEYKKAMKKLRKQVYNPPYPRRRAWRRGLFSGWSGNGGSEAEEEEKEEGKECAVCLEAFVANEHVLVTPCNHMFHNDCLVPWVKLHGKCPVCRFVFCEKKPAVSRNNSSSSNSFNAGVLTHGFGNGMDGGVSQELVTLIRAMEEAFNWMSYSRPAPHQ